MLSDEPDYERLIFLKSYTEWILMRPALLAREFFTNGFT